MLRPWTRITIGDKKIINYVQSVEVESRRNEFTDKATIVLSNNIAELGGKVSEVFKLGDKVTIEMGYFPNIDTRFNGYISEIIPDRTCTIVCEDESYIYKRDSIGQNISQNNTTTTELFEEIYKALKLVFKAKIGDWRVSKNASVVDILNKMRQQLSIYSYWRNDKLIVGGGLNEEDIEPRVIIADFQGNVPEGESSINLKEATSEQVIVKGESKKRDGSKIIVYGTYSKGNEIVLSDTLPVKGRVTSNINLGENDSIDKETLQDAVTRKLQAISYTGVNGNVTIYGEPAVRHGDNVRLKDATRPEIDGLFKCVGVVTSFSVDNGFRQNLELGIKLS